MTKPSTAFAVSAGTDGSGPAQPAAPAYDLRLARDTCDLHAAARLRYRVFVQELGADGPLVDHAARTEADHFDPFARHLVLVDPARPRGDHVVGLYRLIDAEGARGAGGFSCEAEFDIAPLRATGRPLLELGRSCVDPAYRNGAAVYHLWQGLASHVARHGIEILFGVASFPGTNPQTMREPLSYLHHHHLAPAALRPVSRAARPLEPLPRASLDRRRAMLATPALIKAYLRLGGHVGAGIYVDRAFNTTDVCMTLDTARMNPRQRDIYAGPARA